MDLNQRREKLFRENLSVFVQLSSSERERENEREELNEKRDVFRRDF